MSERSVALRCSVNVGCGPAEERLLLTGLHAVADIYCENCHTTLGWKYVSGPGPRPGRTARGSNQSVVISTSIGILYAIFLFKVPYEPYYSLNKQ